MTRDRYIELLKAGPEISADDLKALALFRPQLTVMAASVRSALRARHFDAVFQNLKARNG